MTFNTSMLQTLLYLRHCSYGRIIVVDVVVTACLQAVVEKVKSFSSSRTPLAINSSNDATVGTASGVSSARRRSLQSYALVQAPIREESKEWPAQATTLTDITARSEEDGEYVIQSQTFDNETFEDASVIDVDKTREQAAAATADAGDSEVKQERPESPGKVTSGAEEQPQLGSKSTISTEFSRQFVFGDADKETGKGLMHSAWWLEKTNREKSRVDGVLVDALQSAAMDKRQLDEDKKDAATTAKRLHQAAEELSVYAMKVAIRSSNDLPLSDMAIRSSAAVTLSLLNRAILDESHQLPASGPESGCDPFQIHRAAVIVNRVLEEAANRNVPDDAQPRWSKKSLLAAILLVQDVLAKAITDAVHCTDTECTVFTHLWTPPAIRATCLIVDEVMDEAALKASPAKERSISTRHPTQQTLLPVADAGDADREALEEEAIARSSARLDTVGPQSSSLAVEPTSDMIAISNSNNSAISNEVKLESSSPIADRSSEAAAATDNANTNTNNAAAGIRSSGSRLRQLFGRRRRNT